MRIKICGVTTVTDARTAAALGADAIGLNFYSGSPRRVADSVAEDILLELPPFVEPVAVMATPDLADLLHCGTHLGIRTLQCHALDFGKVADEALADAFATAKTIVAHGVATTEDLEQVRVLLRTCLDAGITPAAVLVDARMPGQHGGTGRTLPWQLLDGFAPGVPLILAGGLTPDNVAEAIRIVRPYAVDVASGVESTPGIKDVEKMRRFIGNAREAAERYGV
jgi:phosphoribosylanthranilate isomerase